MIWKPGDKWGSWVVIGLSVGVSLLEAKHLGGQFLRELGPRPLEVQAAHRHPLFPPHEYHHHRSPVTWPTVVQQGSAYVFRPLPGTFYLWGTPFRADFGT